MTSYSHWSPATAPQQEADAEASTETGNKSSQGSSSNAQSAPSETASASKEKEQPAEKSKDSSSVRVPTPQPQQPRTISVPATPGGPMLSGVIWLGNGSLWPVCPTCKRGWCVGGTFSCSVGSLQSSEGSSHRGEIKSLLLSLEATSHKPLLRTRRVADVTKGLAYFKKVKWPHVPMQ